MATIAGTAVERGSAERKFYCRMALLLVAVVLLGFAPSFYLRGVVPSYPRPNPSLPPSVLLHGGLFSLWMLAFVAQTQLVAAGRRDIHKKLGAASMLLALAIVPMMYLTTVWQVERANQPPFTDPLNWTIVPLAVILPYAFAVWTGWRRRREAQWHKRMMLSAAILVVMGPAIARLPIAPPTLGGFTFMLLLGLALFVPLYLWDRRSLGQVHPATKLGFALAVITIAVPLAVFWTGTNWASVAARLPGV
jgi:cytochrome bd-type quinol oxidase subunit 2